MSINILGIGEFHPTFKPGAQAAGGQWPSKHGVDFVEAQSLWNDSMLLEIRGKTEDEPRFLFVGQIAGKYWAAVITYRGGKIRLISVRRARAEKVALYES